MTLHQFEPRHFHNTIGSHEPVLRIASGDSVRTWCVDARGADSRGEPIARRGNPMTGPFYVEGAAPGDTLAVHFDRMWPNRTSGWTARLVAPNVVDPDFIGRLGSETELDTWRIDLERGTLSLTEARAGLEALQGLPADPMIGCFGVAPDIGEAISTATSGRHGGNMDYRGFRQGVTVYFPVFVEGALFHLGDGHAIQGCGEIVGTGVETSFDVEFTVRVVKGRAIGWPRAETADAILTAGNARPLDQALQHATTEMLAWMEQDYGLDKRAGSILLGQLVRYEVGNVFDPAYTMICLVEKRHLPPRKEGAL